MATVFIPSGMQELTGGVGELEIEGATVRRIIRKLDEAHPGTKDWLVDGDRLKPNISVAIDGVVSPLGLLADVEEQSEVHFVAAISGGRRRGAVTGGATTLPLTSPTG
jgi:molybdopterin synthase sulfur carrier subunit